MPRFLSRRGASADLAKDARDYLLERNVQPLKAEVDQLIANARESAKPSLPHPLLSKAAHDFRLSDWQGQQHTLAEHLEKGTVVLVFYYGYYCNHCVSQLFALQDDLTKFHELGAEVIAVSPDTPQETAAKFGKYGKFTFPVLSDSGNQTATAYSVFIPAQPNKPERLLHGTFVIDKRGIVRWCHYADAPFTDNATLLVEVAKAQGRMVSANTE